MKAGKKIISVLIVVVIVQVIFIIMLFSNANKDDECRKISEYLEHESDSLGVANQRLQSENFGQHQIIETLKTEVNTLTDKLGNSVTTGKQKNTEGQEK